MTAFDQIGDVQAGLEAGLSFNFVCPVEACASGPVILIAGFPAGQTLMQRHQIQIGSKFGKLTVDSEIEPSTAGRRRFACTCDCGTKTIVQLGNLTSGHTLSCGCLVSQAVTKRSFRHGYANRAKTSEYNIWCTMKARCSNPNSPSWKDYGARGIRVCDRWQNSFVHFIEDMGERPVGFSIDRYPDNNGNYEPGNCRWAAKKDQARNTRSNRLITFYSKTQPLVAWAAEVGIKAETIAARIKRGWSIARALTHQI